MIRMIWNNAESRGQLYRDGKQLQITDALTVPVVLSVFTWATRRLDGLIAPEEDRRGYWGDTLEQGDTYGCDLWQLSVADRHENQPIRGGRVSAEFMELAAGSIRRSLEWMITDGIARTITVDVQRLDRERIAFRTEIVKGHGERYADNWEATFAAA